MTHHTTQQSSKDIAAAKVASRDSIANQMAHGSTVIANHFQAGLALVIQRSVINPSKIRRNLNQWIDEISFIVVGNALKNLSHSLKSQTCVDIAVRERSELALRITVVLHKHQVVELNKTTVVLQINSLVT
ncbi:MAG: Uncharacterised protein [Prochlorococcus marinus str. MIT 9215]|nr:MAG: Uncharacterised protein [Prochlorococcus marinus str. MIT 9215]